MAKQQFTLSLGAHQVQQAVKEYAAGLIDTSMYDVEVQIKGDAALVRATKRRAARKAKAPKVAVVPKAAA